MSRNIKGQFEKGNGLKDLTGKQFGKLKVVGLDKSEKGRSYWKVKCQCGTEKVVRGDTLKVITSCGCAKKEQDIINLKLNKKRNHGMTKHRAFQSWSHMMARCYNKNNRYYRHYGGRGIIVCDEWQDAREFCKWADENGFEKGLTIERKNVNGNYEPSNCCWIPQSEQSKNRRNTIKIVYGGKEVTLSELSNKIGMSYATLASRWHNGIRDIDRLTYNGDLRSAERRINK